MQVGDARGLDIMMLMYNLLEYSDNYVKTLGSLYQYCRDEPALYDKGAIVDFDDNSTTDLFNFKEKISQTDDNGAKNVEITVPLKYFNNFWGTLEINFMLKWSANFVILSNAAANQATTFEITDPQLYVPVVTL